MMKGEKRKKENKKEKSTNRKMKNVYAIYDVVTLLVKLKTQKK